MKSIEGFPGYFVNESGEVFVERKGQVVRVSQRKSTRDYVQVDLFKVVDGKRIKSTQYVHRLVLLTYKKERRPDQLHCRHLDDNNQNNCLSNLAWGTAKENAADRKRHGVYITRKKLSRDTIFKILQATRDNSVPLEKLAKHYNVTLSHLKQVLKGKYWLEYQREFYESQEFNH